MLQVLRVLNIGVVKRRPSSLGNSLRISRGVEREKTHTERSRGNVLLPNSSFNGTIFLLQKAKMR